MLLCGLDSAWPMTPWSVCRTPEAHAPRRAWKLRGCLAAKKIAWGFAAGEDCRRCEAPWTAERREKMRDGRNGCSLVRTVVQDMSGGTGKPSGWRRPPITAELTAMQLAIDDRHRSSLARLVAIAVEGIHPAPPLAKLICAVPLSSRLWRCFQKAKRADVFRFPHLDPTFEAEGRTNEGRPRLVAYIWEVCSTKPRSSVTLAR